jgi:hypothetical protein
MAKPQKAQNSAKAAAKKRIVKVDAAGEVTNLVLLLTTLLLQFYQQKRSSN